MDKDSSVNPDKIMAGSKGFCYGRRQKNSGNNSQRGRARSLWPSPIALRQPPRGKRALLCCISYKEKKFELKGTIHDLKNMRDLLLHHLHFPVDSILLLAEKDGYPEPTRKNIEDGFEWLTRGIQEGDSLLFYFSGHGLRQRSLHGDELHGDELDGFDETICPLDFETNGMIFDNYINETIVKPLIKGVTLHAIVDSCHSGTVLDLPLVYNINTGKWDDNGESKGTSGGKAICFSACEDYQQAADTSAFSPDKNTTGAMTGTFIKAVKAAVTNKRKISYRDIMLQMRESLKRDDNVGSCAGARLRRVFTRKILQDPLLSSSEEFDANTEFRL